MSVNDEVRSKKRIEYHKETYNVIGDFVLRVNHVSEYVSRCCEQLLFPFFPPQLIGLGDEGSWHLGR